MWILEFIFVIVITFYFIKRESPNFLFLLYGYIFFLVSLLLQIPLKLFIHYFQDYFSNNLFPLSILTLFIIVIIPVFTKYFSLKRFLKTKSYKNGILFGIGWASVDSLNYFKELFLLFLFSLVGVNMDLGLFLGKDYGFFSFLFVFITNLAITILIIISLIKNNKIFLFFGVLFNLIVYFGIIFITQFIFLVLFYFLMVVLSLFIIFNYRQIKKLV